MVELKKGNKVVVTNVKKGTGKNGKPYWMCRIKGDKGFEAITIWSGECSARDGDTVVLCEIESVKHGSREYNGKWYADVSVNAIIANAAGENFSELPDDDGELPF